MTPSPQASSDPIDKEPSPFLTVLKWAALMIAFSFALGFFIAGVERVIEDPKDATSWLIAAAGAAGVAIALVLAFRLQRSCANRPVSHSERSGNRLLIASGASGAVIALAMIVGTSMMGGDFGALLGLYCYAILVPAWWLGWRAGLLPEPQHMLIYLAVLTIWSAGWLWRRIA